MYESRSVNYRAGVLSFVSEMGSSFNPVDFLREVRLELQKVTWPNREETVRLTAIVISVTVVVGVFIGGFDLLFTRLLGFIV